MAKEALPFDAAEFLQDDESQTELLADAFDSGDPGYVAHAVGVVARARGMAQVAKDADLNREALYRALSRDGDPRLSTFLGVMNALGIKLQPKMENRSDAA
ncbi:MAG: putative addiction module antidote protein [Candidatus Devosia phytovorans]|uniref:Addiction module antidote protein n=1 Tax=Candidatus Devosia phytovorans TaxID=3121372 RepID=A0AAJ5VRX0_9HYPH|nr:addiction module antidote protein [Devosia sp.]WEK02805.1 MAG: putative addiction module antidote protein [Devosia sp.]